MFRVQNPTLLVLLSVLLAGFYTPAIAENALTEATRTHEQAAQTPAGKFIQGLGDLAIEIVSDKKRDPKERSAAFEKVLSDYFDLRTIARFVIGRAWHQATPEQQAEYMDLFRTLVLRTYGTRMTLYSGENFKVIGTRPETDMDTVVLSQITHPDGSKATSIDWRVRQKDGRMGVIDIVVEGISLSVTQKQGYASILQNNHGKIESLLQAMRNEAQVAAPVVIN